MAEDTKTIKLSGTVISDPGSGSVKVRWFDGSMEAISHRFSPLFEGISKGTRIEADLDMEMIGRDYIISEIRSVSVLSA